MNKIIYIIQTSTLYFPLHGNIIVFIKLQKMEGKMLFLNFQYQVNVFTNNSEINYSPENAMRLMTLFKDFGMVPNQIHEFSNTSPVPLMRPRLSTPDGEWAVTILSTHIAIDRNFNGESIEIPDFFEKVKAISELFMTEYKKSGKRVSLVTKSLFPEMEPEILDSIYRKFTQTTQGYQENKPFEWNIRSVNRMKYNIAGQEEDINFITNVGRTQGNMTIKGSSNNFDRIILDFDINTIVENENYRFSHREISEFIEEASRERTQVLHEIEGIVNG